MKKASIIFMLFGLLFAGAVMAQVGKEAIKSTVAPTGKDLIKSPAPAPAPVYVQVPAPVYVQVPAPAPAPVSWIDGPILLNGPSYNLGITVYYQQIQNGGRIILHEGMNQWVMLSNGAIVLKDNPSMGLTVLNQDLVNGSKIILHEGYNLWKVLSNGAIVLKDHPHLGITVLNQNHTNEAEIILHEGYNTWRK